MYSVIDSVKMDVISDLLQSNLEKSFIQALIDNPNDKLTRKVYIDFLKERGRDRTAYLVENKLYPVGSIKNVSLNGHDWQKDWQVIIYPEDENLYYNHYLKVANDFDDFDLYRLSYSGGIMYNIQVGQSGYIPYGSDPTNYQQKIQQSNYIPTDFISCGMISRTPIISLQSGFNILKS